MSGILLELLVSFPEVLRWKVKRNNRRNHAHGYIYKFGQFTRPLRHALPQVHTKFVRSSRLCHYFLILRIFSFRTFLFIYIYIYICSMYLLSNTDWGGPRCLWNLMCYESQTTKVSVQVDAWYIIYKKCDSTLISQWVYQFLIPSGMSEIHVWGHCFIIGERERMVM